MEKTKIPALYKEDLLDLLKSINEAQAILNGERTCLVCSNVITMDNIQLLIPRRENQFDYVCNNTDCIKSTINKRIEE